MRLRPDGFSPISLMILSVLCSGVASAQDQEPNDTCAAARDGGAIAPPVVVSGSIDGPSPTPPSDRDFLRLRATPGALLRVTATPGARAAVFSEACALLAVPDTSETEVDFTVPASGVFVLGIAERFDELFDGGFGAPNSGPYSVSLAPLPPPIGSITGRIVDAVTGRAVSGGVELRRCTADGCSELVNLQGTEDDPDGTGVFHFETDFRGRPILSGDFALTAVASGFEVSTRRFGAAANQQLDLGDVRLTPPPIVFENVRPCSAIPVQGGTCQYSVGIRNNMPTRLAGQALSAVEAGPAVIGAFEGTHFEATALRGSRHPVRPALRIPGNGASRDVTFFFRIPPSLPERTMICTTLQVGLEPVPAFNVARRTLLFCLVKESSGFRVMGADESRASFERMRSLDPTRVGP